MGGEGCGDTYLFAPADTGVVTGVLDDELAVAVEYDAFELVLRQGWLLRLEERDVRHELGKAPQVGFGEVVGVDLGRCGERICRRFGYAVRVCVWSIIEEDP